MESWLVQVQVWVPGSEAGHLHAVLLAFLPAGSAISILATAGTSTSWSLVTSGTGTTGGPSSPRCRLCAVCVTDSGTVKAGHLHAVPLPLLMPAGFPVLPCLLSPTLPDSPISRLLVPGGSPGEDLERNDGSQERPYFMSPELRDILLKGRAEEGKRAEVEE